MWKYALKILMGADPRKVVANMPKEDFRRLKDAVSQLEQSGLSRSQRRKIQRKWNKVYGNEPDCN